MKKTLKKVAHNRPKPFNSTVQPRPQPKIDFPYHEISGPEICSLICASGCGDPIWTRNIGNMFKRQNGYFAHCSRSLREPPNLKICPRGLCRGFIFSRKKISSVHKLKEYLYNSVLIQLQTPVFFKTSSPLFIKRSRIQKNNFGWGLEYCALDLLALIPFKL